MKHANHPTTRSFVINEITRLIERAEASNLAGFDLEAEGAALKQRFGSLKGMPQNFTEVLRLALAQRGWVRGA